MNEIVQSLRTAFNSNTTKSISWRVRQLNQLRKLLDENEKEICRALKADLNKPDQESIINEIGLIKNAITYALDHMEEYSKPKKVVPNLQYRMSYSTYIQYQPYGVILIIGAWNYPFQVSLVPLVGAIACGNCALVKPSELAEQSAKVMETLIGKYMDNTYIKVVNGGVKETIDLLKNRFDSIIYTGSTTVGKSIMEAAAKHMTPVTLECGGKSPVFIDSNADLSVTAKRVTWGRFSNAGQTCIAPDYILCTKEVRDKILPFFKKAIKECYGENPNESEGYSRIINGRHFQRIKGLIDESKVVFGGRSDEKQNYIEPTIMFDVNENDKVMQEEIFGPILPFVTVKDHNEAIDFINRHEKPLALYVFSKTDKVYNDFLDRTSSGAYSLNEVLLHCCVETLPFGGVGGSGMGAYHGPFSFETFSHKRAVLKGAFFGDSLLAFRYPPFNKSKLTQAKLATTLFPRSFISRLFESSTFWVLAVAAVLAYFYKNQ